MRALAAPIALTAVVLASAACTAPADDPVAVQSPEKAGAKSSAAKKPVPIKLTAKRATAKKSVIASGGALSCARVTVTNQSKKNVEVNPLYFSLTDTTGAKHDTGDALGDAEGQIDNVTLAPGEHVTGLVCGKGKWVPKVVAMTDTSLSEAVRAAVS